MNDYKEPRCQGSGKRSGVGWTPQDDYPGGGVCDFCGRGVLFVAGSVKDGTGKMLTHTRPKTRS